MKAIIEMKHNASKLAHLCSNSTRWKNDNLLLFPSLKSTSLQNDLLMLVWPTHSWCALEQTIFNYTLSNEVGNFTLRSNASTDYHRNMPATKYDNALVTLGTSSRPFSTRDRDNADSCALHYGGWWHSNCGNSVPTGESFGFI